MYDYFQLEKNLSRAYDVNCRNRWEFEYLLQNNRPLRPEQKVEYDQLILEKEEIKKQLIILEEKPLTKKKHGILANQIKELIEKLNPDELGRKVTSNQGSISNFEIYREVISDLAYALQSACLMWHVPHFQRTFEGGIDTTQLKQILSDLLEDIYRNPSENYILLIEKITGYVRKIEYLGKKN